MNKKIRYDFLNNRANAKRRNVEFNLTFEEWWLLWKPYYHNRGIGKEKYQLCRKNDIGPYSIDNCYIDTQKNNRKDQRNSLRCYRKEVTISNGDIQKTFDTVQEASDYLNIQSSNFRKYMRNPRFKWFTIE